MRKIQVFERKKYFIVENNILKSVSQGIYENWLENNSHQFELPVYVTEKENIKHTVDTDFSGVTDRNETAHPFVLFHFEDLMDQRGMKAGAKNNVEYFETFEELKTRRQKLINAISKN